MRWSATSRIVLVNEIKVQTQSRKCKQVWIVAKSENLYVQAITN